MIFFVLMTLLTLHLFLEFINCVFILLFFYWLLPFDIWVLLNLSLSRCIRRSSKLLKKLLPIAGTLSACVQGLHESLLCLGAFEGAPLRSRFCKFLWIISSRYMFCELCFYLILDYFISWVVFDRKRDPFDSLIICDGCLVHSVDWLPKDVSVGSSYTRPKILR